MRRRKIDRVFAKMTTMRAAKERKRLDKAGDEPARTSVKGLLAHTIIIQSHITGVSHVMRLTVSIKRIDQYAVEVDGKLWKKQVGMSHITAGIRKALPPFTSRYE